MTDTHGEWGPVEPILVPDATITDGHVGHPPILDDRGLFVVHAVMLCTGKVLWFCGHVEFGHYPLLSYVFDPKDPTQTLTPISFPRHNPTLARSGGSGTGDPDHPADSGHGQHADLFCSHYVQIPDGRILLVGGSDPDFAAHSSKGEKYIFLFDPIDERWEVGFTCSDPNRLDHGRWYPTAVLLGDGRVFVASGRREFGTSGRAISDKVELLSPPEYKASDLSNSTKELPIYPGLHLAPNGRIYYTHTNWGQEIPAPANTLSIEVASGSTSASWTDHTGRRPDSTRREEGMSVLLPPANDGKILLFGGGLALASESTDPDVPSVLASGQFRRQKDPIDPFRAEILDTTGAEPTWTTLPDLGGGRNMHNPRVNGHGVILPDYTVLILGGCDRYKWNKSAAGPAPLPPADEQSTPSNTCEIFDPATNIFTEVAAMTVPRMYHAAAVLLPDGRVIVAGGAHPDQREPLLPWPPEWPTEIRYGSIALNRKDYQIYEPPYFFYNGSRPEITRLLRQGSVTTQVLYGENLGIETPQAADITRVALMRPCCPTHHTDTEQRLVEIPTSEWVRASGEIIATMPVNRNLAPPGWYMVWIMDTAPNGKLRPCVEAAWVQLAAPPPPPPTPSSGPCVVVTAAMGSETAPEVVFLRQLRRDIRESGRLGQRFIRLVNGLYDVIGPPVAARMREWPALRISLRDLVVHPAKSCIAATANMVEAFTPPNGIRWAVLVTLLAVEGAVGLLISPALLLTALLFACTIGDRDA